MYDDLHVYFMCHVITFIIFMDIS